MLISNRSFPTKHQKRHAHILDKLINYTLFGLFFGFIYGLFNSWFISFPLGGIFIVASFINSLIAKRYLRKNEIRKSVTLFTTGGFLTAVAISLTLDNVAFFVPFVHAIGLVPMVLFLNKVAIPNYIFFTTIVHGLIYLGKVSNSLDYQRIVVDSSDIIPILLITGLIIVLITYFGLSEVVRISIKSIENETALISTNRELSNQVIRREKAEQTLKAERALLADQVRERTIELEDALKRKDSFLAMMSHELRTPLNTILSRTQALSMGVYGGLDNKHLSVLSGISNSGDHLLELINEILDVAKLNSGEFGIEFEQIEIDTYCRDVIEQLRPIAEEKALTIHYMADLLEVEMITADSRRLRQILINLIANAIKFTPNGKNIGLLVSTNPTDKSIIFEVWDEGIGIPEEEIEDIFQPFIQVDSELARQHTGTGLGLTLVRQLAELHHGEISLQSQEGIGSRFIVILPIFPPDLSDFSLKSTPQEVSV